MANLLVRDVPDDVHEILVERARSRGQSLQQYLRGELERAARTPTIEEVLDRIEARHGGRVGLGQAAEDLQNERARR